VGRAIENNVGRTIDNEIDTSTFYSMFSDLAIEHQVYIELTELSNFLGRTVHTSVYTVDTSAKMPIRLSSADRISLLALASENDGEYYFSTRDWLTIESRNNRFFSLPEEDHIIYLRMINDGLYVIISAVITPVEVVVDTLKIQLYFVTVVMIVLSLIIAFYMSKRISKPIVSISKSAMQLAEGQYNVKFDSEGFREINELSKIMNYATVELSKVESLRKELIANISHDLRTPLR